MIDIPEFSYSIVSKPVRHTPQAFTLSKISLSPHSGS